MHLPKNNQSNPTISRLETQLSNYKYKQVFALISKCFQKVTHSPYACMSTAILLAFIIYILIRMQTPNTKNAKVVRADVDPGVSRRKTFRLSPGPRKTNYVYTIAHRRGRERTTRTTHKRSNINFPRQLNGLAGKSPARTS